MTECTGPQKEIGKLRPMKDERSGKWGYVDKNERERIPYKYDLAGYFREGLAYVELNHKIGYIDSTGTEIIPFKYSGADFFYNGLAKIQLDNKYFGYIDKSGKEIIPAIYEEIGVFNDGLAKVTLNGKYGYINKTGKEVIVPKYDYIDRFSEGFARVEFDGSHGFIDTIGNEVAPPKHLFDAMTEEWESIRKRDKLPEYKGFISKYPWSEYANTALKLIAKFEATKVATVLIDCPKEIGRDGNGWKWVTSFSEKNDKASYSLHSTTYTITKGNTVWYPKTGFNRKITVQKGSGMSIGGGDVTGDDLSGGIYECIWTGNDEWGNPLKVVERVTLR